MSGKPVFDLGYVKRAVAAIEKDHLDESAHMAEDILRAEFIAMVAEAGSLELAELAREVMKTDEIEFSRWYG